MIELAKRLGALARQQGLMIATAESCTGGWAAQTITSVAGSSGWFDRGFVTYSDQAKQDMLGVRAPTLERFGAVSELTAREMAEGALARSRAGMSVAITGIAGPDGGTADKPVGTVWFAWAGTGRPTQARAAHFSGDREAVRRQAVECALQGLIEMLESPLYT